MVFETISPNSLVVQWVGLSPFSARGLGLIPGRGTKILQDTQNSQKKKEVLKKKKKTTSPNGHSVVPHFGRMRKKVQEEDTMV